MSYLRKQGENIVSIRVHSFGDKSIWYTIIALVVGIFIGVVMKFCLDTETLRWIVHNLFDPVETLFMNALIMVAAPMIFFSVISGIAGMSDTTDIGRMGGKLIFISILKLAVMLGLSVGYGIWLGAMPQLMTMIQGDNSSTTALISFRDVIMNIVPKNLISPFEQNNLLQVLFLAMFFGMVLVKSAENSAPVRQSVVVLKNFFAEAMKTILPIMPLVVAVSTAKLAMNTDLFFLSLIVSAGFIAVFGKISPVPFLKKILPFSVLPFSRRTCSACLPDMLDFCAKKFGMEEKLSMFAVPVGLQFNALGSGSYVITVAILMRITVGLPIDMEFMLSFFFVALLMAFTFPAVPGATILVMTSIFAVAGVPVTAVTLFIGIDLLVDGIRTSSNAVGVLGSAFLLARLEDKIDKTIYDT